MNETPTIFLAGTIDGGHSADWQHELVEACECYDVEFYNPRRYNFPEHPLKEDVVRQIRWEQEHLDAADYIIMVIMPGSKSPVTLLEMGLYAHQPNKLLVFCAEDFYRRTNVEETCRKYNLYLDADTSIDHLKDIVAYIASFHKQKLFDLAKEKKNDVSSIQY